ncbi:hypothetical protein [Duganella margarita]|nr:hypothetical protein [Duganella margarita]
MDGDDAGAIMMVALLVGGAVNQIGVVRLPSIQGWLVMSEG